MEKRSALTGRTLPSRSPHQRRLAASTVPLQVPVLVLVAAEEEQEAARSDTSRVRARIKEEEA
jgi:hypothetical protein